MKKYYQSKNLFLLFCCLISFVSGAFFFGVDNNPISPEVIKNAEKIMGLEFTQSEIDSMLDGIRQNRQYYENNRKIKLENEVSPALIFNPLPQGFVFEKEKKNPVWSEIGKVELPANKSDLAFYSIRQLAELIRNKKISSLELTQFFLERLKKYSPKLECTVTLTEELALSQARRADEEIKKGKYRGLLHGIPYGAKDLLAVKNYKTTWGSVLFKEQIIDKNATVIQKLEEAGAVLLAKLTLGELAWGDVWFGGLTRNPWNIKQGSSGSSAGSASAVSAGLMPFAIGSETLGSIVSPSTVCGVTGLRPTFGRVSRNGAMALSWSMDKIGPMCRNVEDCALVFNTIYGTDGVDKSLINTPFNYNAKRKLNTLKIGYLKKDFEIDYRFKENDQAVLQKMKELGVALIPMELPQLPDIGFILWTEAATAFDELTRSNTDDLMVRQIKNAWPNYFRQARFVPAVEYIQANRLRSKLIAEMYEKMKGIDVYLSPSFAGTNLSLTNLTGHPCLVLPSGFTAQGTPMSITFIGKLFGEAELLTVAKAFQDATDFHLKHPVLE